MNRSPLPPVLAVLLLGSAPAYAQFGGQPGGMGPGGMPQPMEEPREEGPAEAAPEEEAERPADLEPLGGYPGQLRRRTQIVELDGYFRFRTDFFHNLHLGQTYTREGEITRLPPFPLPLACGSEPDTPCDSNNLGGGNLRLRLEPTVNVTDQVRASAQIDVLDNIFLGGTPDSLVLARPGDLSVTGRAPVGALHTTAHPPVVGTNSWEGSVRAKRAWGEVDTEFGSLRFGRLPWHFGRGIAFNSGACMDCEGGTTVDRVMALTTVYGHQLQAAWDFGAQGYHAGLIDLGRHDLDRFPLDLSQSDDVFQLMASLTLFDDERRFRERVELGELVVNYGAQLVYRQQNAEIYAIARDRPGAVEALTEREILTREDLAASLTTGVNALVFLPGLWFKLGWRALTLEAEVSAVLGRIDDAGPLVTNPNDRSLTVQQLGWVLASELRLYRNAFFVGFETGGATGDQAEDIRSHLNFRWRFVRQPVGDQHLRDFKFNPDYHVDQILFRRILGTVTNAVYVKPAMTYWMDLVDTRQLGLSAALIYSLAPVRVSTPGNALSYGVELNLGLQYRNPRDGFYAGATYGVLWPMAALDRGVGAGGMPNFGRMQDAESAQVFRTFLGIRF